MSKSPLGLPKLRFKGFDGKWEEKTIKDVLDYEIYGNNISYDTKLFLDAPAIMKKNYSKFDNQNSFFAPSDTIIFIKDGSNAGNFFYSINNSRIASTCAYIKTLCYNLFIYYLLENNKQYIQNNLIVGETIPHLYKNTLINILIHFPSLQEQTKIATFFSLLDKQIELWEKKLQLVELAKKKMMSVLFTCDKFLPKLRFKGFHEKWEAKKLKDILDYEIYGNNFNNILYETKLFLDAPAIMRKTYSKFDNQNSFLAPSDTIIFIKDGSNAGNFFYSINNSRIASTCDYIKTLCHNAFIHYLLENKKQYIQNNLIVGETIPHLYKNTLINILIHLPSLQEQTKISYLVSVYDKLLEKINNITSMNRLIKIHYLNAIFL